LHYALADTNLKDSIISPLNVDLITKSLDEEEIDKLKLMVEELDYATLTNHRMYHFTSE
jgi:hypothetical protein